MRILFWGTPEFACPSLRAIIGEGHDVVAVITQPDRHQGRSRTSAIAPPVKDVAIEEGIPVLQPEKPRGDDFVASLRAFEPDLSIVVAYGHILTQEIIDLPRFGTWNVHASLLPRWRGAAPIQAAILAGDEESGVSIMRLVKRLDAGPVLLQAPTAVAPDETGGELTERLAEVGALAIIEALTLISLGGGVTEQPQDEAAATYAPKVDRDAARIDFQWPADRVARTIRAFDPRPGAWAELRGVPCKLFGPTPIESVEGDPGRVLQVDEHGALIGCGRGAIRLGYLQLAGKRRMAALDLAQGRGISEADTLR